jgi:hypothetical protein
MPQIQYNVLPVLPLTPSWIIISIHISEPFFSDTPWYDGKSSAFEAISTFLYSFQQYSDGYYEGRKLKTKIDGMGMKKWRNKPLMVSSLATRNTAFAESSTSAQPEPMLVRPFVRASLTVSLMIVVAINLPFSTISTFAPKVEQRIAH